MNGHISAPAVKKPFVAKDHFKVDISGKVKISYLGEDFKAEYLDQTTVAVRGAYEASSRKLTKNMLDKDIWAELGDKHETDQAFMFFLMEKQGSGKSGVLLTDGSANIFYIYNPFGVLRAVVVSWGGDGWIVYSSSVEGPYEWGEGCQVFSRNSGN